MLNKCKENCALGHESAISKVNKSLLHGMYKIIEFGVPSEYTFW